MSLCPTLEPCAILFGPESPPKFLKTDEPAEEASEGEGLASGAPVEPCPLEEPAAVNADIFETCPNAVFWKETSLNFKDEGDGEGDGEGEASCEGVGFGLGLLDEETIPKAKQKEGAMIDKTSVKK